MKLTMLGTGNALVTDCYNTCFLLDDKGQTFLVDGGGGNTIPYQIKSAGYDKLPLSPYLNYLYCYFNIKKKKEVKL